MSNRESHCLSGCLNIVLHDAAGHIHQRCRVDNLITNAGRKMVAQMFAGILQEKPELLLVVGAGEEAAAIENTQLGDPRDEVTANISNPELEEDGKAKVVATVGATLPEMPEHEEQVLREAGIVFKFSAEKSVLYNRVTFPQVTRTDSLQMTLSWEVSF